MSSVSQRYAAQVVDILVSGVPWESMTLEELLPILDNPKQAGEHFTSFLKECGKFLESKSPQSSSCAQ